MGGFQEGFFSVLYQPAGASSSCHGSVRRGRRRGSQGPGSKRPRTLDLWRDGHADARAHRHRQGHRRNLHGRKPGEKAAARASVGRRRRRPTHPAGPACGPSSRLSGVVARCCRWPGSCRARGASQDAALPATPARAPHRHACCTMQRVKVIACSRPPTRLRELPMAKVWWRDSCGRPLLACNGRVRHSNPTERALVVQCGHREPSPRPAATRRPARSSVAPPPRATDPLHRRGILSDPCHLVCIVYVTAKRYVSSVMKKSGGPWRGSNGQRSQAGRRRR